MVLSIAAQPIRFWVTEPHRTEVHHSGILKAAANSLQNTDSTTVGCGYPQAPKNDAFTP